jgi:hypothetical protein
MNDYSIHVQCTGTWDTYIWVPEIGEGLVYSSPGSWSWDHYFRPGKFY